MSKNLVHVGATKAILIVLYLLIVQESKGEVNNHEALKNGQTNLIGSVILSGDTVHLQKNSDTVSIANKKFDFIEINFVPSKKEQVDLHRFYLKGKDDSIGNWTYKNSVTYTKLEEGSYDFVIKSKNTEQSFHLVIAPSFNRYVYSTIILLVIIFVAIFLLKVNLSNSVSRKVNVWRQDSIAPFVKKYLKKEEHGVEENRRLSNRASVKYEKATVLFADIQGFTKIVEHMNPETLIDELDRFFVHFDEVAEKYRIEKIKTIGDAYMCAGGLPEKNRTNPIEVVLAAIEMQQFMQETGKSARKSGKDFWELRIGIHTGSVISGVIGQKSFRLIFGEIQ